jgi:type II secretory pathway pseudopilin PulG
MTPPERRRNGLRGTMRRKVIGRRARRDGVAVRRVEIDRDILMAALAIIILLLGAAVAFSLYQQRRIQNNQDRLDRQQMLMHHQQSRLSLLEDRQRLNSYRTAYRFCTRINVDRAALHWLTYDQIVSSARGPEAKRALRFANFYRRRLEDKAGMPILDCFPNITGNPAAYMTPHRQRTFVSRWARHKLAPSEIGICKIRVDSLQPPPACVK